MPDLNTSKSTQVRYCLGIDGGGTKTALLLTDINGAEIRYTTAAACNPMDVGFASAETILSEAIDRICEDIPKSEISMFAGIAGGGKEILYRAYAYQAPLYHGYYLVEYA
jgi:N-acetylglucosamine kinase-like BadF-type ATPase